MSYYTFPSQTYRLIDAYLFGTNGRLSLDVKINVLIVSGDWSHFSREIDWRRNGSQSDLLTHVNPDMMIVALQNAAIYCKILANSGYSN